MLNASSRSSKTSWLGWKVLSLLSRYRGTLVALAGLIAIAACLDVAVPFFTQRLIDRIIRTLQTGLTRDGAASSFRTVLLSGVGIFAATAGNRILRSLYNYRLIYTASQCEDQVKNAAFRNFLQQDTAYQSSVNTGEVVGALDRGGTAIYTILYEVFGQNLVPSLLVVLGVILALSLKNGWMALIVSLPLPTYTIAISRLSKRLQDHESQVSIAFENVTKESYDIASNVRAVKKFVQERQEGQRQQDLLGWARSMHYKGERLWALMENVQAIIVTAGRVAVLIYGGYLVLNGGCTVGDFVLFIALQDMVYVPISQISIIVPKLRRNLSRAERLFEILEHRPTIVDSLSTTRCRDAAIVVDNVTFAYPGADHPTLRNVSLAIAPNTRVALIGASGSGKSTLMALLQRLFDPQEGSIRIGGVDLRNIAAEELRSLIGIVPQEVELFSRSLWENISYGCEGVTREQVEGAARLAQAHDFISRLPLGYDSPAGERGLKLSGGERQRIGIARAILRDPEILILDEATSHLDNESERLIQAAMETLLKGRTSFVIAHRLSTVKEADLVIVFNEQGIEAIGTHEQLWRTSPTYCKLHGSQLFEAAQRRAA